MSNLQSGASEAQLIDLFQNFKMPIMGAGGGFAPLGTINFFDASIAPQGWLACDGSVLNITDYPELATYYASVHGSSNFYGGNGTTTFAVPDLQGEFLRGSGTNSHANQGSGANVGVHQDGTEFLNSYGHTDNNLNWVGAPNDTGSNSYIPNNVDSLVGTLTDEIRWTGSGGYSAHATTGARNPFITSRPTNTSFLICVKATVSGDANAHVYSTDEQVVGTWIDESPVYEKTISVGKMPNNTTKRVAHGISNLGQVVEINGTFLRNDSDYGYKALPLVNCGNTTNQIDILVTSANIELYTGLNWESLSDNGYVTIRYTKTSA